MIWAVSNICLTNNKRHAEIKLTPLEAELQKHFYYAGEVTNYNDDHQERKCWHDNKMATQLEKAFCVLVFQTGNLWPILWESSIKILRVRIQLTFSGWVTILLTCQQLRS
jgi:hypothetical protein